MDKGIYYNLQGEQHTFKLVGELRAPDCFPLAQFIEKLNDSSFAPAIRFDLENTIYLDSTMLGLIGKTALICQDKAWDKPYIYYRAKDTVKMLETMGMVSMFDLYKEPCPYKDLKPTSMEPQPGFNLKHHVLQAHQSLIKIDASNQSAFELLINQLQAKDDNHD